MATKPNREQTQVTEQPKRRKEQEVNEYVTSLRGARGANSNPYLVRADDGVRRGDGGPVRGRRLPGPQPANLLGDRAGDLRGVHHVRLPAAAALQRHRLRALPGRVHLPGRAERLPVLPVR